MLLIVLRNIHSHQDNCLQFLFIGSFYFGLKNVTKQNKKHLNVSIRLENIVQFHIG